MTQLFDMLFPDAIIAVADILRIDATYKIERAGYTQKLRNVTMRDGRAVTMQSGCVDRLMHQPVQIMPATPGTAILHAWVDGEEQGVTRSPVIAWGLCVDGEVRPITPQGVNDDDMVSDGDFYILMPDGTVEGASGHMENYRFDTFDEYCQQAWADIREKGASA